MCVCDGALMVDELGHQGIPLKGQLSIRRKKERKKERDGETLRVSFSIVGHNHAHQ